MQYYENKLKATRLYILIVTIVYMARGVRTGSSQLYIWRGVYGPDRHNCIYCAATECVIVRISQPFYALQQQPLRRSLAVQCALIKTNCGTIK